MQAVNGTWHRNLSYSCKMLDTSDADFLSFGKRADRKSHSDAILESLGRAKVSRSSVEHLCTTYIRKAKPEFNFHLTLTK